MMKTFRCYNLQMMLKFLGENMKNVIRMLKCFQEASGLPVNLMKNRPYGVVIDPTKVDRIAHFINFSSDKIPLMYLGLPVGKDMRKIRCGNP